MTKKSNTTTKPASAPPKKQLKVSAANPLKLEWTVPSYRPHRGFIWWSVTLTIIFLLLVVLIGFREWWVLLAAAPISCLVIVQNVKRQPESNVLLTDEEITIEYTGRRPRKERLALSDYSSFTTIEFAGDKRNAARWTIVLKPKKRGSSELRV